MNDFVFCSPTRFVFGRGFVDRTGAEVAALGAKRVLLVYGGGSVRRTGTLQRVMSSLSAEGVEAVELDGVRPNPEVGLVRTGIELARTHDVDLILAVGGGSVIDCAKAIAFGVPYEGDVWDFFSGAAKMGACLPLAVVLTIPAAGSEASASCVISNDALSLKKGVSGDVFRPRLAIMDPELTFTLPQYQTAAGVTDMICHICERYFGAVGAVPVTDGICESLIRSLMDAATVVRDDPTNYDARAAVMWVGTLAHNDLCGCGRDRSPERRAGGWESHGLEHEISAHSPQVTHGAGLAVILPAWMRHVWHANPGRFLDFAKGVFDVEPVDETDEAVADAVTFAIDELQRFFVSLGMPRTLGDLDVTPEDVRTWLVTLRQNKGERFGEFMPLTLEDARAIYESAF
ncbi:iron-containing alcohol dehydrogenase [Olsenella massiliensis]|uniref:iron-containing alcohol dehydrogenase n=1 Tax=Olsenella massiliensis TaxID=1622075 RepID=UPI00071DAFDD|nr:iron-containing alcohol dehydrogenase [Olsenella massiliensis]